MGFVSKMFGEAEAKDMLSHMKVEDREPIKDVDGTDVQTAPFDPRFPNTNQTRYCYTSFLDFQRCKKRHGEDHEACKYFKRVYTTMCPNNWVEKWNDQIDGDIFAGNI